MRKLLLAGAFSMLAVPGLAYADGHTTCGNVSVTEMNWESASVMTKVAEFLMTYGYGCNVSLVPSSTIPAVASVAENNEPDVIIELWVNSAPLYKELEANGKVEKAADLIREGGLEAWWIPTYLAEKHPQLKTLDGILDNPELVGGRFHNCPVGWGCRNHNDNMIKAFGVADAGVEIFNHGSGETLGASIASAYESKAPWFGYYWGPTAVLGKYKMTQVDVGDFNARAFECNSDPDCPTPGQTRYASAPVLTVVTTDFASREPDVAELMTNMRFPNQLLSDLLAWKDNNKASASEAAAFFLANHREVWGSWLNNKAAKKLGFRR